jgi:pyruvate/2-oxoglutarate/acetoin dehydrogenase E1 component
MRLAAPNSVPPCAQSLEKEFLINPDKIAAAVRELVA